MDASKPAWGLLSRNRAGGYEEFATPFPTLRQPPPHKPLVPGTLPQPPPKWISSYFSDPLESANLTDSFLSASYRRPDSFGRVHRPAEIEHADAYTVERTIARPAPTVDVLDATTWWQHGGRAHPPLKLGGRTGELLDATAKAASKNGPLLRQGHESNTSSLASLHSSPRSVIGDRLSPPGRRPPLTPRQLLPMREHVSASGFSSEPFVSLVERPALENDDLE